MERSMSCAAERIGWSEKILHSFQGGSNDGSEPFAGIVFDAAGNIYGTTEVGGNPLAGTVYELVAPVGIGGYKEKVLWKFDTTNGYEPVDSLILDGAGNLYGTTPEGGQRVRRCVQGECTGCMDHDYAYDFR